MEKRASQRQAMPAAKNVVIRINNLFYPIGEKASHHV
jgi:hypothetical protein